MSNTNIKVIYSLRIHIALQKQGFHYITEMRNPSQPHLNCWVYEITPELSEALEGLMGGKGNG